MMLRPFREEAYALTGFNRRFLVPGTPHRFEWSTFYTLMLCFQRYHPLITWIGPISGNMAFGEHLIFLEVN